MTNANPTPTTKPIPAKPAAPTPPKAPADPHKTAAKLDEVDALRLENPTLKVQNASQALTSLQKDQQAHVNDIVTRYTGDNETISLGPDGRTIVPTKKGAK